MSDEMPSTTRPARRATRLDATAARPAFTRPCLLALDRGPGVLLVIDVTDRSGWPRLGCRVWVWREAAQAWGPTREGFDIRPCEGLAFLDAVQRGLEDVNGRELAERIRRGLP